MKKDFVTFYHERLDYIMKKNMAQGIKGLRQSDFKLAQDDVKKYIRNSIGGIL